MPSGEDFQNAEYSYHKTLVADAGEVDYFVSEDLPEIEIRVTMERSESGNELCLQGVTVTDKRGATPSLTCEDGAELDSESLEVLAWEHIERDGSRTTDYAYGREACSRMCGEITTTPGDALRPINFSEEPAM